VLIGFHGYAETAESQLERLEAIPGAEAAAIVSVQGLHRFYRGRTEDVVASWMTRQDRELALADNRLYVDAVVAAVAGEAPHAPLVFAGFSQGVAMAFRAAAVRRAPAAVIGVGGDIPPELDEGSLSGLSHVLLVRGRHDDWYTHDKWQSDVARLSRAGVDLTPLDIDAAHEWPPAVSRVAGDFLRRLPAS
jgi:predicted esterase